MPAPCAISSVSPSSVDGAPLTNRPTCAPLAASWSFIWARATRIWSIAMRTGVFSTDCTLVCAGGSGGAGTPQHFVEVFEDGAADEALAASIFHFGIHDVRELKATLQRAGIPVRLPC